MSFVQQQVLDYPEHKEELAVIARALDLIQRRDIYRAIQVLVARHDHLITSQKGSLRIYDQREQLQSIGAR